MKKNSVLKKFLGPLINASAKTLAVYIFTIIILAAFFENYNHILLPIASIIYPAVFCYLFLYSRYVSSGAGTNELFSVYKDKPYTVLGDIKEMFVSEWKYLLSFFAMNMGCMLLCMFDKLIFGKRAILTTLTFVFAPLNMVASMLPSFAYNIIGYLLSTVILWSIYIPMVMLFRKKMSK